MTHLKRRNVIIFACLPGYRFNDFVKIGVPLQVLAMIVTLLAVPLLFPLK